MFEFAGHILAEHAYWEQVLALVSRDMVYAAGIFTSLGTLGYAALMFHRKVIVPIRAGVIKASKVVDIFPVLLTMAEEFKPNHGSSLRDSIDRIENNIGNLQAIEHLLLNTSEVAHFQTDEKGGCIWVNQAYMDLTGLTFEQCLGSGWQTILHEDDRGRMVREWFSAIKHNTTFIAYCSYVQNGEHTIPVRTQAIIHTDRNGVCTGALGSVFRRAEK